MTVAAFVLGIIGTALAAASLTSNIVVFLLQGARPKLTPVVGILTAGGLVTTNATRDIRESLVHTAAQLPPGPPVIGVEVVNAVARWEIRADPSGTSLVPVDNPNRQPRHPVRHPARRPRERISSSPSWPAPARWWPPAKRSNVHRSGSCSQCRAAAGHSRPSP